MSIADKLVEVAENVPKVFEAGKKAEYDRFWDAFQQNGERKIYRHAFSNSPFSPALFRPKYDFVPTDCVMMFAYIGLWNSTLDTIKDLSAYLKKVKVSLNTSKATQIKELFYSNKAFTRIPSISAESATDLSAMFYNSDIAEIEKIVLKTDGSNTFGSTLSTNTFGNCIYLKNITFEGVIGNSIKLQWCPLTRESITNIVEHLSPNVTGRTVTFKKSAKEAAFTDAEWQALIAIKPNWTISLV